MFIITGLLKVIGIQNLFSFRSEIRVMSIPYLVRYLLFLLLLFFNDFSITKGAIAILEELPTIFKR